MGQLQAKMKFGSPAASRHVAVAAGELRAQGLLDDEAIEQNHYILFNYAAK